MTFLIGEKILTETAFGKMSYGCGWHLFGLMIFSRPHCPQRCMPALGITGDFDVGAVSL